MFRRAKSMCMINRTKKLNYKEQSKFKAKNINPCPMGITYINNHLWKKERHIPPYPFEYKRSIYSNYSIWW